MIEAIGLLNRLKTIRIAGDGIRATSLIHNIVGTLRTAYQPAWTYRIPRAGQPLGALSLSIQTVTTRSRRP